MKLEGTAEVIRNLESWRDKSIAKIENVSKQQIVPMLEKYAKQNRPWTDRTGNARRGLHGKVVVTAREIAIQLHHGVSYGVYLELSHAGRYAILRPTLEAKREEIARILEKVL
jgi:hypothetical protein